MLQYKAFAGVALVLLFFPQLKTRTPCRFQLDSSGSPGENEDPLRFADYEKKQSTVTCETAALLSDHVTLVDALDGWQDGILTIGTFGLDHHLKKHTEYSAHEEYSFAAPYEAISDNDGEEEPEEQEAEEQDAELHPLAISAFKQELEQVFGTNPRAESQILKPDAAALTNDGEDNLLRRFLGDLAFNGEDEAEKEKKKKGERTTLADLFSADARAMGAPALTVAGKCGGSARALPEPGKKTACRAKNVRSLAKKLITWKGEESRYKAWDDYNR
ncbi:hypothetical protein ACLOJK_006249 [Asimina triloba]